MGQTGIAREEHTKNADTFHQKQNNLSPITRFCKFLVEKDYSDVLCLPPKFAETVEHLAGQETQIEDSSALRWSVTFSYVDGSLAFEKGWPEFFQYHNLQEGQFLVFNYIEGSHFIVEIYGKGCSVTNNPENERPRQNKRSRIDPEPFQDHQSNPAVANADFGGLLCLPISTTVEDPVCMINRNDGCYQGEDRSFLYDLHQPDPTVANAGLPRLLISTTMEDPVCMINRNDGCYQEDRNFLYDLSIYEMGKDTRTVPSRSGIVKQTKRKRGGSQMAVVPYKSD